MFLFSVRYSFLILLTVIVFSGCDKIPFLSKFFPSTKTEALKAAEVPSVPAAAPAAEIPADVLAKVGNWTLTVDEFNKKLKDLKDVIPEYDAKDVESKKLILEELVRQQLLIEEAQKTGVASSKDIVDAVDEFRNTLLVREMATRLTQDVTVTQQEIEDYYKQNKDAFSEPAEWHIREIMTPTETEAKDTLIELLKGTDFAVMAQTHSKAASAPKGGDIGFISEPKFPQMGSVLSALEVGSVSQVFKGPDGYYIIKLEEKKGGQPKSLSEVSEEIKTGLTLLKQQQKVLEYIDDLKTKTPVVVNENLIQ